MSAGTITLTNGSAIVGGSGTSFATELAAGDFIVSTVGGVPYTLPVKSVESNVQLTLVSSFTGPTQSDTAWSAVPHVALNMVTAALVAQSAEALRGLNYDKQNWQQVYSAAGNITVKLPDGTTFTGPSWNSITTTINNKADKTDLESYAKKGSNSDITSLAGLTTALSVEQGGTGKKTASEALSALGGLPLAGGTMAGSLNMGSNNINAINVLNFQTTAAARQSLLNMGVSLGTGNSLRIPISQSQAYCIQVVTAVITLNSNGDATVTYSQSYASVYSLVAISGDFNVMTGSVTVSDVGNNNFNVRFRTSGNTTPTGNVRINYIVAGLINI